MEAFKVKHEEKFSTIYKACRICANDDEDALVKKVIGNGIKIAEDGKYHCIPCNIEIPDEKQFYTHITGSAHLKWVDSQLFLAAAVILRVDYGFTIKNGSFFCMVCKTVIGSGLAAVKEISTHHNSSCEDNSIEENLSSSDSYSSDEYDSCDSTENAMVFRAGRLWCHSSCEACELDLSWSDNEWEYCYDD